MICYLCGYPMEAGPYRTDGHGLGECVDICAVCDGDDVECSACNSTGAANHRWFLCTVVDSEVPPEPDWSRVPEAKREDVRLKWMLSNVKKTEGRYLLWGPQIPWYQRQPYYHVSIVEG